jgi:hypothetical protein
VVSIDSTKIEANAAAWPNRTRQLIAEEILAEVEPMEAAKDAELAASSLMGVPGCALSV